MPFGAELAYSPTLAPLERAYIRLFGAPVLGLRIRSRAILPLLSKVGKPNRLVDAGCGRGTITMACARAFPDAEVIGIDLDENQCQINARIAERIGISNLRFLKWDVLELARLGKFDVIISTDNLEHLVDDLGCAQVFFQALNPAGFIVVHVPHLTRNLFGWHTLNWMGIEGHVRPGYTRDSLVSLLRKAGFEIVESGYNYNSIETFANDLSYLITGGHERNKSIYAVLFPFLLGLAKIGSLYKPTRDGTGVIAVGRRPLET